VRKSLEPRHHDDRNGQFTFINGAVRDFQEAGQPAVSVDTKKKDFVGDSADVVRNGVGETLVPAEEAPLPMPVTRRWRSPTPSPTPIPSRLLSTARRYPLPPSGEYAQALANTVAGS
jgi:hypothetical protein